MLRRWRAGGLIGFACLLAAAIGLSGAAASSPAAAKHPHLSYGVNAIGGITDRDAALMASGGITVARVPIIWPAVQSGPKASFNWAGPDGVIRALAQHGIEPLPILDGTPAWVAKNPRHPPLNKRGRKGWRRFIRAAIHQYGPGGTFWLENPLLHASPIRHWEIWNEPNFPSYFRTRGLVHHYFQLLRLSAKTVHKADPGAKAVLAGLGPGLARKSQVPCWKFLARLYHLGAKRYFDVAADHPYAANVHDTAYQVKKVAKVMRRHHDHAPLWINEIGWSSGHLRGNRLEVGKKKQAKLLSGTFRYLTAHAHALGVRKLLWFDWRDPVKGSVPDTCPTCFDFGLRRHNYEAKPAWRAFTRYSR